MSRLEARAQEMITRHGFLGVPAATFEQAGREQLIALLNEGLAPESKILDIGCGCLRVAYWLIRFLDPGGYFGIEPARQRVEYGLQYLFEPGEIKLKQPHFDFNVDFDSSIFGVKFDFFLARSIWTHGSKRHIEAMLDSFLGNSVSTSIFLASYLPAQSSGEDYQGDGWVGTSHECSVPGVVRHDLKWILDQCQVRRLALRELAGMDCDSQLWLRVSHE